jgi:hypothetical protein
MTLPTYQWVKNPTTNSFIPIPDREEIVSSQEQTIFSSNGASLRIPFFSSLGAAGISLPSGFDRTWPISFFGLDIGEIKTEFKVDVRAFLSGGVFDAKIPSLFTFTYDKAVLPGSIVNVKISSDMTPQLLDTTPQLKTYTGFGLGFGAGISLSFDSHIKPVLPNISIEGGLKLNEENFLAILENEFGVGLDLNLVAQSSSFKNNMLSGEDNAYQFINQNSIKTAALIPALVPLKPAIDTFVDAIKGFDLKAGVNINQKSTLTLKSFEIDWDNLENGNELSLLPGESGNLQIKIPENLYYGSEKLFQLTVRPRVEITTVFEFQPQLEFNVNLAKLFYESAGIDLDKLVESNPLLLTPLFEMKKLELKASKNFTAAAYTVPTFSVFDSFVPLTTLGVVIS